LPLPFHLRVKWLAQKGGSLLQAIKGIKSFSS
jgi:hypothetical protein